MKIFTRKEHCPLPFVKPFYQSRETDYNTHVWKRVFCWVARLADHLFLNSQFDPHKVQQAFDFVLNLGKLSKRSNGMYFVLMIFPKCSIDLALYLNWFNLSKLKEFFNRSGCYISSKRVSSWCNG